MLFKRKAEPQPIVNVLQLLAEAAREGRFYPSSSDEFHIVEKENPKQILRINRAVKTVTKLTDHESARILSVSKPVRDIIRAGTFDRAAGNKK